MQLLLFLTCASSSSMQASSAVPSPVQLESLQPIILCLQARGVAPQATSCRACIERSESSSKAENVLNVKAGASGILMCRET